jgi:hypothetical protein
MQYSIRKVHTIRKMQEYGLEGLQHGSRCHVRPSLVAFPE